MNKYAGYALIIFALGLLQLARHRVSAQASNSTDSRVQSAVAHEYTSRPPRTEPAARGTGTGQKSETDIAAHPLYENPERDADPRAVRERDAEEASLHDLQHSVVIQQ